MNVAAALVVLGLFAAGGSQPAGHGAGATSGKPVAARPSATVDLSPAVLTPGRQWPDEGQPGSTGCGAQVLAASAGRHIGPGEPAVVEDVAEQGSTTITCAGSSLARCVMLVLPTDGNLHGDRLADAGGSLRAAPVAFTALSPNWWKSASLSGTGSVGPATSGRPGMRFRPCTAPPPRWIPSFHAL